MGWTKVDFLTTGDSYYETVVAEIAKAQTSILMEAYIFRADALGKEIIAALAAARARQVRVFLRLDGAGSREEIGVLSKLCEEADIELEVFHPLPFAMAGAYYPSGFAPVDNFLARWRMMNRRNHRKLLIVDEKIAFAGGRNVDAVESEKHSGSQAWHDLSLRLEGEGVQRLLHAFWFRPGRHLPEDDCLMNHSWRLRQERNNWLARKIQTAQKRVWITTPYFSPTPRMLFHVRAAAKRGVDIRIVLSKKSDVMISRWAALGIYRRILRWNVKLFEFIPVLLHSKLWIIDDTLIVGSGNFNHRSFIHDIELDCLLRQEGHVAEAAKIVLEDQKKCEPVTWEAMGKVGVFRRMLYWCVSWFSYWL